MRKYNINVIIQAIENLYDRVQGAVLFNGSTEEWFRTIVGNRQGCLLLPTPFNIFLERIICEALDNHEGSVSIGGRLITIFRFADDIVGNTEQEEEAGVLVVAFYLCFSIDNNVSISSPCSKTVHTKSTEPLSF